MQKFFSHYKRCEEREIFTSSRMKLIKLMSIVLYLNVYEIVMQFRASESSLL